MRYYIKKMGYAKHPQGFAISEIEKNDCLFWIPQSKVFWGTTPSDLTFGDIIIQKVSSNKTSQ